jgi:signal transduction histidine kinase
VQTFQVENPGRLLGFFQVTVYPMGRVGAVQIIQDITEEKEMQAGLIQAEKMAVLGRMSASLAHEVSNPLQALRSGLSLLLKPSLEEDKRRHYLNIASAEVRRLIAIVDRMVSFYRPSADVYANTDLNSLLREVLTLAEEELQRHRVRITCQFDEDLPKLQLVSDQIRQVFLNIILNAVEAMPGGGRLTVSTVQTSSEVQISFSDTGVGMEPAVLAKVFDPFYTTKETGTGLGLSISCRIVERQGGQLQVSSEVGEGSVFTVCLPLLRVNHEAAIPEP